MVSMPSRAENFHCHLYPIGSIYIGEARGQGAHHEWGQEPILSLLAAHKPHFLQCYRDLALVSRDGMNIVLNKINQILMEKYLKLQDTCRTQVRPGRKERSSSET